jgi:transcriptional regulator with XRE-family HTH domain
MVQHGITYFRTAAGMTQAELADRLGYEKTTVRNYESGRTPPSLFALQGMALVFGTTIDALLSYERPEEPEEGSSP